MESVTRLIGPVEMKKSWKMAKSVEIYQGLERHLPAKLESYLNFNIITTPKKHTQPYHTYTKVQQPHNVDIKHHNNHNELQQRTRSP